MKKKRIMSLVVLLIFASCVILPCFSVHVYAGEIKTTGYWKFARSWDEQTSSLTHSGSNYNETISGSASGGFHDRCEIVADGYRYSYTSLEDRLHEGGCNGEYGEAVFTFSPLPGATLQSGEKLGITASVSCSTSGHHVGVSGQLMIDYTRSLESNSYTYFKTEVDTGNYVIVPEQIEQKEGKRGGSHWDRIGNISDTYYTIIPSGKKSGDSLFIRFHFNAYETRIDSIYQYEWIDTTPVAAHAEDTGNTDGAEDIGNADDTGKDDVTADSSVPEEETSVAEEGENAEQTGDIFQTITQFADEETGEDNGAGIITAIIIGVGGALAAAGALSSSGGNKDGGADQKRQKSYKMKVYKGFGDSIRKGAKPVTVWARIVEAIDGEDINRPELSEKIIVSGSDMNVKDAGMENTYRGAEVSIPADSEVQTATLTFTYNGEGGVFRNNIIFKVIGEPEIVFCSVREDKRLIPDGGEEVILIAGAGGTGQKLFILKDATQEPQKLLAKAEDGTDVIVQQSNLYPYAYNAVIRNNYAPMKKEGGIFAEPKSVYVKITAEFPDGITVEDGFYYGIWPQGLTVLYSRGYKNEILSTHMNIPSKLQNGRLEVLSYAANVDKTDKIPYTAFDLCYAVMKPDGTPRIVKEYSCFKAGELQPTDEMTKKILEKYRYQINTVSWDEGCELSVCPKDSLLESEGEIHVTLPVTAFAEGQSEKVELPLRLLGVQLDTPSKDWQKEYDELCRTILRFFPAPYGSQRLRDVKEVYGDHHMYDASEIRAVRYNTLRAARDYWYREGEYYQDLQKLYEVSEVYFKKPIRFIGDTAFSIVIKYYWPKQEGWISPVKDVCVDTVEEAFWEWIQFGENNFFSGSKWLGNVQSQATTAIENYISITDGSGQGIKMNDKDGVTKLAVFLFLYMTVDCLINYYGEPEESRDFWESVRKTFLNTSIMAVKKIIGAGFEKAMNSETVQKFFKSQFMQKTTEFLNENLASETVNMKGSGVYYRDGMKFNIKVDKKVKLINSGNLDKLQGRTDLIHFGREGKIIDVNDLDLQHKMLGMNGQKIDLQVLNLSKFNTATYVNVIQEYINGIFGKGVGMVFESVELDPESKKFGEVNFPIGIDPIAKTTWCVSINLIKLAHDASGGLFCPGFDYIYELLFGWLKFPGMEASKDIGKEIFKLSGLGIDPNRSIDLTQ